VNRQWMARLLVSLLAAAGVAWSGLQPTQQAAVKAGVSPPGARETLRVGMWTLWHDREVILTPAGPDRRIILRSCAGCAATTFTQPATIRADGDALTLTAAGRKGNATRVWISEPVTLTAHGETVTLRDPVAITAREGALVIVVALPVESYVERVVASESGAADSAESLKALAIVVRSFALHEEHGHADYDLCDSTHCQLLHWGGNGERGAQAHAVTLATGGETLWFHEQRALAYFGKDCGGRTASPVEIWPHARLIPYLPSQPDRFCTADGGREWASEMSRAELTAALAKHGLATPGWQNIAVGRRGESGRAVTIKIDGAEINADEFRLAVGESLGWNKIPSTWFEVSRQGDGFAFHGRGWGHGAGLCQKGASVMAQQGRFAQEILAQYFPGTRVADEATGREWRRLAGDGFVLESLDAGDAAYLPDLNRARAEATEQSGLNATAPLTVRAFASTTAFREGTLAPGWVAAFTEGDWIGTQPLRTLAGRRLLADTMRHEFLHALVEEQAGPQAPLWLREGLVEVWSEANGKATSPGTARPGTAPALTLDATDNALTHPDNEAESAAAHRAAEWYAAKLLARYGRAQVLDWLRSGVPAGIVVTLGQR
jgi:stage II sporulation protein D (peptidoglycan lytic transglycosylase)